MPYANPEEQRKYQQRWYTANRKRILAQQRVRNAMYPERRAASRRKYDATHKEEKAMWSRSWRKRNPEKVAAYKRKYRKAHLEERAAYQRNRKAFEAGAKGSFTAEEFRALCDYTNHLCPRCFEEKPLTIDHIVALSKGGSNDISNIQPLCKSCNCSKGVWTVDYLV